MQPPWSIAMSIRTDPFCIERTMSSVITVGALLPGTSTAPISRSALSAYFLSSSGVDFIIFMLVWFLKISFRSSILLSLSSNSVTHDPMPAAVMAAFVPAVPPPTMTTLALGVPVIMPSVIPLPLYFFWRYWAPYCIESTPAISLMGARSGRRLFSSVTVSYAMDVMLFLSSCSVSSFSAAARWRYVYKALPFRSSRRGYSSGRGSFTLTTISDFVHMSSFERIFAPLKM